MVRRLIILLVAVLVFSGLIAYSKFRPGQNRVSGMVEADEIRVGSRVGGRVLAVHVEEGERVKRGQVLLKLEPFDLLEREKEAVELLAAREAEYQKLYHGFRSEEQAQAQARLEQFQARLDLLEAGPRKQEIEAARGRLDVADAAWKLAKTNYKRREDLYRKNSISVEKLEEAEETLKASQAMVVVRKNELVLLELGNRNEEIEEARARVKEADQAWQLVKNGYRQEEKDQAKAARDAAQASLNAIREKLKELTIAAPVDGVVDAFDLKPGDLVPAGAPVLSVLDDSHLWVRAYVPQNRVGLRVGQELWVTSDIYGDTRFLGKITFLSHQAEFTPSNVQTPEERVKQVFRTKVALKEDLRELRPGMTVDVWLNPVGDKK